MGNGSYQLILEGLAEGSNLEEVKEKLAAIFKTKPDKVAAFFIGRPVVVKKGVDNATALKYKTIFEGAGATCRIDSLEEGDEIPAHMIEEGGDDIPAYMIEDGEDDIPAHMIEEGEDDIPAHMLDKGEDTKEEDDIPAHKTKEAVEASQPREGESMVCPKCGYEQAEAQTCIGCGIRVDRFLKLMKKKEEEERRGEEEEREEAGDEEVEEVHREAPKVVLGIDRRFYEQAAEAEKKGADQTGFINNLLSDRRRLMILGGIAFFLILGFFEFFILRGDLVVKHSIRTDRRSDYVAIWVDHAYQKYLVDVSTGGQQRKLSILLEDPIGRIVYEDIEYAPLKGTRRFTFEPDETGTYTLYINDGAIDLGERGYAKVRVYMNDNRILGRVFGFLNF